jgi:tetratricopeptide (TPR) repeat protein
MQMAKLAVLAGGMSALLLGVAQAQDVAVHTRDGATYEGRLISDDDEAVVLEIKRGTIVGTVTIPKAEITQRSDQQAPPPAHAAQVDAARGLRDPAERAQALLATAAKLELDGDPLEAARLYEEAGRADPSLRDQTDVSAARALTAGSREVDAERVLRAALERNPKNTAALAAARSLEAAFEAKARELIEPGVRLFLDQQYRRALRSLVSAVEALPKTVLDAASKRVHEQTGLTLEQIMVDCRLRAECRDCDGAGVKECPAAAANTITRCRFGRKVRQLRKDRVGMLKYDRWEECRTCNGRGHLTCRGCKGLGTHLTRPTEYEREVMMETLEGELGGLQARAEKLTETVEQDQREASVRTVAVTELLNLLQEIRSYARSLSQLDARAGAIGGGDLRRRERTTSKRMAAIMTALANGLYMAGEERYESAVSHDGLLNENGKIIPLAVRSARARQAWEVVNQARIYTLEALEMDPSTAGATRGDLKRRLALMDRFLDRTWKTYMLLRAVEEGKANRKAAFAMIFGGGPGVDPASEAEALSGAHGKGTFEGGGGGTGRAKKR